ncbi:MAG: hypothetical protein ACERJ1_17975 [Halodesulfovibrio sp.]|uniref:hypothetical protein n=1 Tax=Halodesulfovibrio sp. TaxID=1912772 RepID=UPI00359E87E0
MPSYYSPEGNLELWSEKPDGYLTVEEWSALNPEPTVTLAEAKAAKQAVIRDVHNTFLLERGVEYSDMERQTWDTQRLEAQALLADPQAVAPLVRAIANARSMDVLELAQRIQVNTQAWSVLAGHATGQRLKYQDVLEACTTVEQVEAISISFTTPE